MAASTRKPGMFTSSLRTAGIIETLPGGRIKFKNKPKKKQKSKKK